MDTKEFIEQWSAITPHDLGLKAAYWSGKSEDPITYRPIIGWLTITGRPTDAAPNTPLINKFFPQVLSDNWWPMSSWTVPDYAGVVPKDISDEAAKEAITRWRKAPPGEDVQVNVRGVGLA